MKNFFLLSLLPLFLGMPLLAQKPAKTAKIYEFNNGNWFNGREFVPGVWYSVNGLLTQKKPASIDSVINLRNRFVLPPSGDGFCASVAGGAAMDMTLQSYWQENVFYLQIPGNKRAEREEATPRLNQFDSPDAVFGNGGITCTLGKPFLEYEGPANNVRNPQMWAAKYDDLKNQRKMLGDGYWFVDNKKALADSWDKIKAQNPDFLHIYLLDAEKSGGKPGKGLTPDMAKAIVKKAHKSNLRVLAHVETADDLRLGLKIGVDGFANLPGNTWDGIADKKIYELTDDDLKKLAKKKTPVVFLLALGQTGSISSQIQAFHSSSLRRAFGSGVRVCIGSNDLQRTTRRELNYWFSMGDQNNADMLQSICEFTPQAIFPHRKIGKFEEGYEASFVVVRENPLSNLLSMRMVVFKAKKGILFDAE
jgi:hypothetical protein